MKLFLNDVSISSQAQNFEQAKNIIKEMIIAFSHAKSIASEKKGYITKSLKNKYITHDMSIHDIIFKLDTKNSDEEKLRKLMIEVLMKRPHCEDKHINLNDTIEDKLKTCLKETCFDDASSSVCGSLVISAKGWTFSDTTNIEIKSSIYGKKIIMNYSSSSDIDKILRKYEHNEKHQKETRFLNGEEASAMDLSDSEAQIALCNGILIGKKIYSFFKGNWYQFHPHDSNIPLYHGFRLKCLTENNLDHSLAKKIHSSFSGIDYGQVDSNYL